MDLFYQVTGGVLVAVVLALALRRQGQDITLLLGVCVCCMVLAAVAVYLEPVLDFMEELHQLSGLDSELLEVILKAVGVAIVGEIAVMVCNDAGNAALGKALQIMASAVILWLSLPLMRGLLELVQKIVGET